MKGEQLKNKVVIITGASAGIGAACARLMASEGAALVLTARNDGPLNAIVEEIRAAGGKAIAMSGESDIPETMYRSPDVELALSSQPAPLNL